MSAHRAALAVGLLAANPAGAHIVLLDPPPRIGATSPSDPPCGQLEPGRVGPVTTFTAGEAITVRWQETVNHPGHYRIALDLEGEDDFPIPTGYGDIRSDPPILVDGIEDMPGAQVIYTRQVALPDQECTNCTLQVMQLLFDKPPYGNGDDLEFSCADVVLPEPLSAASALAAFATMVSMHRRRRQSASGHGSFTQRAIETYTKTGSMRPAAGDLPL